MLYLSLTHLVAETIFHVFLNCYLNATVAIMGQIRRDYGVNAMFSNDVISYRAAYNELSSVIRQFREANQGRDTPDVADSIAYDALERLHVWYRPHLSYLPLVGIVMLIN
jgi:hypothetical protein